MNKGCCGVVLIVSGLIVFCVRHLAAAWMASEHPVNNVVRAFNSIQQNTGGTLLLLGLMSLVIGAVLLILEIRRPSKGGE